MADHKITNFVDQEAIDKLVELNTEMKTVRDTYIEVSRELIKGIKMKVEGISDIDRQMEVVAESQRRAAAATKAYNRNLAEQDRVIAATTATIAREKQEINMATREMRAQYDEQDKVKSLLEKLNGTYQEHIKELVNKTSAIKALNAQQKELEKHQNDMSPRTYAEAMAKVTEQLRAAKQEKTDLEALMRNEERLANAVDGSYNQLSQQLELLKKAYKSMTEEEKASPLGQDTLSAINGLDSQLKLLAEDMGEHQRNVGDYAIAINQGVVSTTDLNRVLALQAGSVAGCIEQNKELVKARNNLDSRDAKYAQTVARINEKLTENERRIANVDDIINKDATTVAEAKEQNARFAEALKLVDLNSKGAQERIAQLNARIEHNNRVIRRATPALQGNADASNRLAQQMLMSMGVNTRWIGTMRNMTTEVTAGGNALRGMANMAKGVGKALMALCDPAVLAAIAAIVAVLGLTAGFTAVVAGIGLAAKGWKEYNDGLVEATRLTAQFTGLTGEALRNTRADITAIAEQWGKSYEEVLRGVDALSSQFGISYAESMELIKSGFIAGADASGQMLQLIDKYRGSFDSAGISASEFMAIIAQTPSGIFSDKGMTLISTAAERIRRMPKATAEALDAIGISSKKMQQDLSDGTITMLDAIKMITAKLQELPDNSQLVGEALRDVFGRKGADAGLDMIKFLSTIETDLDKVTAKTGKLGELQAEQQKTEKELQEILAAAFDQTGGSYEAMKTQVQIFINKALIPCVKWFIDLVNILIDTYNNSALVRKAVSFLGTTINHWIQSQKRWLSDLGDAILEVVKIFSALATMDFSNPSKSLDEMAASVSRLHHLLTNIPKDAFGLNITPGDKWTAPEQLNKLTYGGSGGDVTTGSGGSTVTGDASGTAHPGSSSSGSDSSKSLAELSKKELEMLRDTINKQLALYKEGTAEWLKLKLQAIEIESELSIQANKVSLEKQQEELLKSLKKGKITQAQYDEMLLTATQNNADAQSTIESTKQKSIIEAKEKAAAYAIELIMKTTANEQTITDTAFKRSLVQRQELYAQQLRDAGDNVQLREEIERDYQTDVAAMNEEYAIATAKRQIAMLEQILAVENMAVEERTKYTQQLEAAYVALAQAQCDAVVNSEQRQRQEMEETTRKHKEEMEKRIEQAQKWLQSISEALNGVNDLSAAIYDAKIQRIEEEQEALDEAAEMEQERITTLVEQNVITEEEGEARKRAAEDATAKRTEELEKRKQALQYKAALWEKANSIAQIGISTAVAIMNALKMTPFPVGVAMAAIAGAMGAMQLASVIATPIPKYAKGTKWHPGGLAIVGDAGRHEIVSIGERMYITPNEPTLVDIPRGASVAPNADAIIDSLAVADRTYLQGANVDSLNVVVKDGYDYKRLERKFDDISYLVKKMMNQSHRDAYAARYESYKQSRI